VLLGGHLLGEEGPNNNIYNNINEKEQGSKKIKTYLAIRGGGQLQYTNDFVNKKKSALFLHKKKTQQPRLITMILQKQK
jgi:hypothetical protein